MQMVLSKQLGSVESAEVTYLRDTLRFRFERGSVTVPIRFVYITGREREFDLKYLPVEVKTGSEEARADEC